MPNSPRPSQVATRTAAVERRVKLGVAGLAGVLIAAGAYALTRVTPLAPGAQTPPAAVSPARNAYTDLFDAAYRPDEGRGSLALATVYYPNSLQDALERLPQPSAHQLELRDVLRTKGANRAALAFYVLVDSVVPQTDLDLSQATLTDRAGQRYPFQAAVKLLNFLPQESGQVRTASVLFFDFLAEDGTPFPGDAAEELTLTIRGLTDPAERSFSWLPRLLPR